MEFQSLRRYSFSNQGDMDYLLIYYLNFSVLRTFKTELVVTQTDLVGCSSDITSVNYGI